LAIVAAAHRLRSETRLHARQHLILLDHRAGIDLVGGRVRKRGVEATGPGVVALLRSGVRREIVALAVDATHVPARRAHIRRHRALLTVVAARLARGFVAQALAARPVADAARDAGILRDVGERFALTVGATDHLRIALRAFGVLVLGGARTIAVEVVAGIRTR